MRERGQDGALNDFVDDGESSEAILKIAGEALAKSLSTLGRSQNEEFGSLGKRNRACRTDGRVQSLNVYR